MKSFAQQSVLLRHSPWDAVLVGLSILHAMLLWFTPSVPLIAVLLWWSSNTISHNFIHLPFFRDPRLNRIYSLYLSLVLGFPQALWRNRHLAHHAARRDVRLGRDVWTEWMVIAALWNFLLVIAPAFFWQTYLPGYLMGLLLCSAQGFFEHWRQTSSHYGVLYNFAFFNDGYHVEHHSWPSEHWIRLRRLRRQSAGNRWPPVLRWIEVFNLETLERVTMRFAAVRNFMMRTHERALRRVLPLAGDGRAIHTVRIVGGGLFPRSALLLRKLVPAARITVFDKSARNLEIAKPFLDRHVEFVSRFYRGETDDTTDLLVIPLAFCGSRGAIYENPPARAVLVHDWIWRRRGETAVVAWWLLKRINLVRRRHSAEQRTALAPARVQP
jgi:hypothetical protein